MAPKLITRLPAEYKQFHTAVLNPAISITPQDVEDYLDARDEAVSSIAAFSYIILNWLNDNKPQPTNVYDETPNPDVTQYILNAIVREDPQQDQIALGGAQYYVPLTVTVSRREFERKGVPIDKFPIGVRADKDTFTHDGVPYNITWVEHIGELANHWSELTIHAIRPHRKNSPSAVR